jgi:hypothetical protein
MVAEDLILKHRDNRLEFSAPHTDILTGQTLVRLRNAAEVPFLIKTTLWSGNKTHVFSSAVDQFIVSYDLWEQTFSVVKVATPRKSVSHLTASAVRDWCVSQMSLDTTGLSGSEPLWARLEIRAEDPPRGRRPWGDSVNSAGFSLPALIEILGSPAGAQPHWTLDYPQFTLDSLKPTRGGS